MELIFVSKMGFNKKLTKSCFWCMHGKKSEFSEEVFCKKHGVTTKLDACRHYKYDPLKRTPNKINTPSGNYSDEDFII